MRKALRNKAFSALKKHQLVVIFVVVLMSDLLREIGRRQFS